MTIDNDELMQKLVRTGMIMRHIDGEGPHGHGHGKRCHGHGDGDCHGQSHDGAAEEMATFKMAPGDERPHGPHGHGPGEGAHGERHGHGRGHGGKRCHGQARVISMVAMQEGITQKDLAFLLGIRPQTLGEMLRKLEERGLLERSKSESDGRAIQVKLTDEGRARAAEIAERRKLAAADMFAVLTDGEKEQLSAILDKLGAEMDRHRPKHHGHHGFAGEQEAMQA